MKHTITILLISFLMHTQVQVFAQTNISGTLTTDTEWTVADSPYILTGTVGVLSGVTLTVNEGVEIQGNFDLLVKGVISIDGTLEDSVAFSQTRLIFKSANLTNSDIEYIKFSSASGVQLADESEFEQDSPKNSGILTVSNSSFSGNSYARTKGYQSGAKLILSNCSLTNSIIRGYYPRSEMIEIVNSNISQSEIRSDSYNEGIRIELSRLANCTFSMGCCDANFEILNSELLNCQTNQGGGSPVNGLYRIENTLLTNSFTNLSAARFNISGSRFAVDQSGSYVLQIGNGTIENTIFTSTNDLTAIRISGLAGYNIGGAVNFQNSTFDGFQVALEIDNFSSFVVKQCNFLNVGQYALVNNSSKNIDATQNYWGTVDETTIASQIFDGLDDINSGIVDFSNYLMSPTADTPISAPQDIFKGLQNSGVFISWESNEEVDLAGYKIHSKGDQSEEYTLLADVGNVTSFYTEQISYSDLVVVTSYNDQADGTNDLLEGNESGYSDSAEDYILDVSFSSASVCEGESLEASVGSGYDFSTEFIILQLSDIAGSFENAINLDSITEISEPLSTILPDTLSDGEVYYLRIFLTEHGVHSEPVEVIQRPVPSSLFDSESLVCSGDATTVTYTGNATVEATYSWDFDGASIISGTGQGPYELSWETDGEKIISLEVSENGCTSVAFENSLFASPEIEASFDADPIVCEGEAAIFKFVGSAPSGAVYNWEFDGGTIVSSNDTTLIEVQWSEFGVKEVSLSIEYNSCISSTVSESISYNPVPTSSFVLSESLVCAGDFSLVTYTGSASADATYSWDLDGASIMSGSGQGPYELFWETDGDKTISLEVSENGCISAVSENSLFANPEIEASFDADPIVCEGETAIFEFVGSAPLGAVYNWEFDGGTIVSSNDTTLIEVQWSEVGVKEVSLSIEYNSCISSTVSKSISYNPVPTSSFALESLICTEDISIVTYTGNASIDATYSWEFDGASIISGSGQGPYELSWETDGEKFISLEVSENGCSRISTTLVEVKVTPTADFSIQSFICGGESTFISYDGNASETATFAWNFDGGTIISGQEAGPYEVNWDSFGSKTVSLSVSENGCTSEPMVHNINHYAYPKLSFEANESACYNEDYQINFTGSDYTEIHWDFNDANIISGSGSGPYALNWSTSGRKFISLTANNNGCSMDTTIIVDIPNQPYTPEICIVSVDERSSKNMILWSYDLASVASFGIYRETNVADEYTLIEYVDAHTSNTYIDIQSEPEQQSNRYKITSLDSCGTETGPSIYHKTVHLTINKGIGSAWNLIWDEYEGLSFGTYRIHKSLNGGGFEVLAEIASTLSSYTDFESSTSGVAYQIEVVNPTTCEVDTRGRVLSTSSSWSNIAQNAPVLGLTDLRKSVLLYPNPTTDYLFIELDQSVSGTFEISTLSGQKIDFGIVTSNSRINLKNRAAGIYILTLKTDQGVVSKKFVKK